MRASLPTTEAERLQALYRYDILDTLIEEPYERLTRLAAEIFHTPIVLITLVDQNRQWFKSCYGLNLRETSREVSFCAHALLSDKVMVVPDATLDERFVENLLVTGEPKIRFYAGAPLKTPEGHNLGTICVIDTRPRSLLSEAETRNLADLAALVVDELELRQSVLELEKVNQRRSSVLANTSHELRTPLAAILGFSELLERGALGPLNEKQLQYARYIYDSGEHLLALTNDILDLSKIEAGRLKLKLETIYLADLVHSTLPLIQGKAQSKGVTLETIAPDEVRVCQVDPMRIKQVLVNLLSNAIKFTPSGGLVQVTVEDRSHEICVKVRDTGMGIADKDQEQLFEPFSQVGKGKNQVEGTGLGLALSKQLVELHGGQIFMESKLGEGSTFGFTLPRKA